MKSEFELSFTKVTAEWLATSMKVPEILQNPSKACVVELLSRYTSPKWKFMDENHTASSAGHSAASKVPRNSFPAPVPASPRPQVPCCGQNVLPSAVPQGYGLIQSYQNHPGSQPHYKICYDLPAPPGVMGTNIYQTSGYRFPQPPIPYERNPMMGYSVFPPPPPRPLYPTNNPPMVCKPLAQPELLGNLSMPYGGELSSFQQPYQLFDGNSRQDYARQRPSISPDRTGTVASDERRKTSTSSSKQSSHSSKKTDVKRGTIKAVVQEKSVKNSSGRSVDSRSMGRENSGYVLNTILKENTVSNERRSSNGTSVSSNDDDIQRLDLKEPGRRHAELLKALTENETRQGVSSTATQRTPSEPFALNSENNNKQGRILQSSTVPDEHRGSGSEPSTQRRINESLNELSGSEDILLGSMTPQTRASTDSAKDPKFQTGSRQDYSNRSSNQSEASPHPKNESKFSPPTSTTDEPQDYRFGMLGLNFSPSTTKTKTLKRNNITDRANTTPNAASTKDRQTLRGEASTNSKNDSNNYVAIRHDSTNAQPSDTPRDRSHSFQMSSSARNEGQNSRKASNQNDRPISRKPSRASNNSRFPKGNAGKNYNSGSPGSKIDDAKKRRPSKEDYTASLKRNSEDNSVVDSISNSAKGLPSTVERQMKVKPDVTLQIQVTTRPNQSPEVLVSREAAEENDTLSIVPTSDRGNDAGYTITSTRNFIDSSCDPRTDSECMPNAIHYHQIKIEGPPATEQGSRVAPFPQNSSASKDNVWLPTATLAEAPTDTVVGTRTAVQPSKATSLNDAGPTRLHIFNTPDSAVNTVGTINNHSPINGKQHADGDQLLMLVKIYDTFIQTKERCQCSEMFEALGLTERQMHLLEELSHMMRPSETNPDPKLIKMLVSNINLTSGQLEKFDEILTSSKTQSCMRSHTGSIFFQPNVRELVRTPSMSSGSSEGQMFWKKSLESSPSRSSRRNTFFPTSTFRGESIDSALTEDSLEIQQPAKRHEHNLNNKEPRAGLGKSPDDSTGHNSRQASGKLDQTTSNLHVAVQEGKHPLKPSLHTDETEARELLLVAQKLLENAAVRIPTNSSKKSLEISSADPLEAALREYDHSNDCCPPPCCANHPRDSSPIPRCLAMAMQNIERIVNSYRLACAPSSHSPKFSPHPYRNIYHPPKSSGSKTTAALSKAAKRGNNAPSVSHTTSLFLKSNKTKAKPLAADTLTPEQQLLLRDLQANPELCQLLNSVPGQHKQQESKKQESKTKKADPAMNYGLHNTPQMEPASNLEVASKKIKPEGDVGETGTIADNLQKKKSLRDAGKLFETKVVAEEKEDGKVRLDARPSLLSFMGSDLSENLEEEGASKQDEGGSLQHMPNMPARNLTENDGGTTRMSKKTTKQNDDERLSTAGKVSVVSGSRKSTAEGAPQPIQGPEGPLKLEKKSKDKLNKPAKK